MNERSKAAEAYGDDVPKRGFGALYSPGTIQKSREGFSDAASSANATVVKDGRWLGALRQKDISLISDTTGAMITPVVREGKRGAFIVDSPRREAVSQSLDLLDEARYKRETRLRWIGTVDGLDLYNVGEYWYTVVDGRIVSLKETIDPGTGEPVWAVDVDVKDKYATGGVS